MKTTFAWLTLALALPLSQTASAQYLVPVFPTYSIGFGWAPPVYSYPYASTYSYGYAPSYYSAGYGGGCCTTSCGTSCGYSCGTGCCNGCGVGGCGVGGCSSCVSQPVSSGRPVPDPISDERRRLDDDPEDYRPPRRFDEEPEDTFERSDTGRGLERDSLDDDWDRSRRSIEPFDGGRTDGRDSMPGFDSTDGLQEFDGGFRPPMDEPVAPEDHSSQKPPMNHPLDEALGHDADAADFLAPEDADQSLRSPFLRLVESDLRSHQSEVGARSPFRLAGETRRVSTKRAAKRREMQWISLPRPQGQARL